MTADIDALKKELKLMIIQECDRDDLAVDDIADDMPLIGQGLGLDSLDALQIATAVKNDYGLRIEGNTDRKHLASVEALTNAIVEHRRTAGR